MVERAYFFDTLYPLQDEVLAVLAGLETGFYLTAARSRRGRRASRTAFRRSPSEREVFYPGDNREPGYRRLRT